MLVVVVVVGLINYRLNPSTEAAVEIEYLIA